MKKISMLLSALATVFGSGVVNYEPRRPRHERERVPLKGTTYHRKVPKTDADRVRCALAADRRGERAAKRYAWAVESNANQRCERSRVNLVRNPRSDYVAGVS